MKIAVTSNMAGFEGLVPETFSQCAWLMIVDTDTGEIVHQVAKEGALGDLGLAQEIVKWDCEGVLCGPLEKEPFLALAEVGITRFLAAGLPIVQALDQMEARTLAYVRDYIGSDGSDHGHGHSGGECSGQHHHH